MHVCIICVLFKLITFPVHCTVCNIYHLCAGCFIFLFHVPFIQSGTQLNGAASTCARTYAHEH